MRNLFDTAEVRFTFIFEITGVFWVNLRFGSNSPPLKPGNEKVGLPSLLYIHLKNQIEFLGNFIV